MHKVINGELIYPENQYFLDELIQDHMQDSECFCFSILAKLELNFLIEVGFLPPFLSFLSYDFSFTLKYFPYPSKAYPIRSLSMVSNNNFSNSINPSLKERAKLSEISILYINIMILLASSVSFPQLTFCISFVVLAISNFLFRFLIYLFRFYLDSVYQNTSYLLYWTISSLETEAIHYYVSHKVQFIIGT